MDFNQLQTELQEIWNRDIPEEQKDALMTNHLQSKGLTYDDFITLMNTNEQMAIQQMQDPYEWAIGAGRAFSQGVLLGFGDEVEAMIRAGFQNKSYDAALKEVQAGLKAFQIANPGVSLAIEIGGAFFTPGVGWTINALRGVSGVHRLGKTMRGINMAGRRAPLSMRANQFGRELGVQTTVGAGLGAGYAAGTDQDMTQGAGLGAAGSAILTSGMRGVGTVGRKTGVLPSTSGTIPPPPPKGPRPSATGDPGDASGYIADQTAIGILAKKALQEGKTFDEFIMDVQAHIDAKLGDEVTLFDLGAPEGELQRTMSGVTLTQQNASRVAMKNLDERQAEAAGRTIRYLENTLFPQQLEGIPGPLPKDGWELAKLFSAHRSQAADELYDLARGPVDNPNVIESPEFYSRMKNLYETSPVFKKIWHEYKNTTSLGKDRLKGPPGKMTIGQFDQFKRFGLDEMAKSASGAQKKVHQAGQIRKLKNELMDMVFNNPNGGENYRLAVNQFSGDAAMEDAFKLGQTILKDADFTPGRVRSIVSGMADDERTYLKIGMAQGIIDAIRTKANTQRNVNVKPLVSGAGPESMIRSKLAAILGEDPELLEEVISRMDREGLFLSGFQDLLKGSPTAKRLANAGSVMDLTSEMIQKAGGAGADLATKNYPGLIRRGFQKAEEYIPGTQRRDQRLMRKFGDSFANRAFTKGAEQTKMTLEELRAYRNQLSKRMDRFPTIQPIQTRIEDYYLEGLLD
tara:strand:- start:109 stop:2334 length:2226 start_codon:yes stop_codon:yes gene_type:complete